MYIPHPIIIKMLHKVRHVNYGLPRYSEVSVPLSR